MGKNELKKYLIEKTGITEKEASLLVSVFINGITDGLLNDGKLILSNFGTFKTKYVESHTARNPKTGETVQVPAKNLVYFKASKKLKRLLAEMV